MKRAHTSSREVQLSVLVFTTGASGKPVAETASVVDASSSGARLSWVRSLQQPGQIADVEYKGQRAKFRVAWIGEMGTTLQGQVGVESLEPGKNIWGLPPAENNRLEPVAALPAMEPQRTEAVAVVPSWSGAERRKAKRLRCSGGAEYQELGTALRHTALVSDISVGGCYIETRVPLAVETRLELTLRINDLEISGTGEVRICHAGMGMGVAFREMTQENRRCLEDLIEKLSALTARRQAPALPVVGDAKDGATLELLLFLVDTLKDKGVLTPEEHGNALARARQRMEERS